MATNRYPKIPQVPDKPCHLHPPLSPASSPIAPISPNADDSILILDITHESSKPSQPSPPLYQLKPLNRYPTPLPKHQQSKTSRSAKIQPPQAQSNLQSLKSNFACPSHKTSPEYESESKSRSELPSSSYATASPSTSLSPVQSSPVSPVSIATTMEAQFSGSSPLSFESESKPVLSKPRSEPSESESESEFTMSPSPTTRSTAGLTELQPPTEPPTTTPSEGVFTFGPPRPESESIGISGHVQNSNHTRAPFHEPPHTESKHKLTPKPSTTATVSLSKPPFQVSPQPACHSSKLHAAKPIPSVCVPSPSPIAQDSASRARVIKPVTESEITAAPSQPVLATVPLSSSQASASSSSTVATPGGFTFGPAPSVPISKVSPVFSVQHDRNDESESEYKLTSPRSPRSTTGVPTPPHQPRAMEELAQPSPSPSQVAESSEFESESTVISAVHPPASPSQVLRRMLRIAEPLRPPPTPAAAAEPPPWPQPSPQPASTTATSLLSPAPAPPTTDCNEVDAWPDSSPDVTMESDHNSFARRGTAASQTELLRPLSQPHRVSKPCPSCLSPVVSRPRRPSPQSDTPPLRVCSSIPSSEPVSTSSISESSSIRPTSPRPPVAASKHCLPLDTTATAIMRVAAINASAIQSFDSSRNNSDVGTRDDTPSPALHALASLRARASGSAVVLPRHLTEAAQELRRPRSGTLASPAAALPKHFDELCAELTKTSQQVQDGLTSGCHAPRVLVVGETSGVVSSMFLLAGADVATCDLYPSEIDYVPHFQGDALHVQNLGWDLVIAHPPCTYLSAVSSQWLSHEPGRRAALESAARVFKSMASATAPFVAVENPRMHAEARRLVGGLTPTQFVQPWEHGTGHQKATGLYLTKGLPPLQPTCVVDGRESAMANLSPSPHRGALRSRTYVGVAGAMATHWMPVLLRHLSQQGDQPSTKKLSALELLACARRSLSDRPSLSSTEATAYEPWSALHRYERGRESSEVSSDPVVSRAATPESDNHEDQKETHDNHDNDTPLYASESTLHDPFSPWTAPPPARASSPRPTTPTTLRKRRQQWQSFGVNGDQKWSNVTLETADEIRAQALAGRGADEESDLAAAVRAPIEFVEAKGIRAEELASLVRRPKTEAQARLEKDWEKMSDHPRHPTDKRGLGYTSPKLSPCTATNEDDASRPSATIAAVGLPEETTITMTTNSPEQPRCRPTPSPSDTIAHVTAHRPDSVVDTLPSAYPRHCLYVRDLMVCRSGEATGKEGVILADSALTVNSTLADTGAGPSVVTTSLLSSLPNDACVERLPQAVVTPLHGPDGLPLITRGKARIVFSVGGFLFRHTFMVIEGNPMLLLGNDFLATHAASIQLASDSADGSITLGAPSTVAPLEVSGSPSPDAPPIFRVSTSPIAVVPVSMTCAHVCPTSANPITTDFFRGPQATKNDNQLVTEPLFSTADEFAAKAPASCGSEYLLYTHEPITIPAYHRATFHVRIPLALREHEDCAMLVDRLPTRETIDSSPLVIPQVERPNSDHTIAVTVVNTDPKPLHLPSFHPVASLQVRFKIHAGTFRRVGDVNSPDVIESLDEDQRKLLEAAKIDPEGRLSMPQREQVRRLLARRIAAFAIDPTNPNHTHVMEVELPLNPGAEAHRHAPSRVGREGEKIIEDEVCKMESAGIIRKSNSSWASRVVLVTKKDGSVRFCVDYRDVNSKLRLEDSPLPLTVEAIDRLSSGQGNLDSLFLCTLDLASGFWGIPIKESDKHITAFTTHRGKYEFNYLPFGVQSGPSYMCRLMDAVLGGLAWEICMPYLDDVGAWSTGVGDSLQAREESSFQQMLHRLDLVLERLIWAGLTCKMSKCVFFATSAEYLGHVVSREGLRMDPKKVEAVSKIDPTQINSIEAVRSAPWTVLVLPPFYTSFCDPCSAVDRSHAERVRCPGRVANRSLSPGYRRSQASYP